jgi:hypothetical protein
MPEPGRDPGPVLGYYREDTYTIAEVVRQVKGMRRNDPALSPRTPVVVGGLYAAKTKTGGFAAGSLASPSTATVTLQVLGTGDALVDGADVTMVNHSTRTITTAGKLLYIEPFNGKFRFVVGDC